MKEKFLLSHGLLIALLIAPFIVLAQANKKDTLFGFVGKLQTNGSLLSDSGKLIKIDTASILGFSITTLGKQTLDDKIKKAIDDDNNEKKKLEAIKNKPDNIGLNTVVDKLEEAVDEDLKWLQMLSKSNVFDNDKTTENEGNSNSQIENDNTEQIKNKLLTACTRDKEKWNEVLKYIEDNKRKKNWDELPIPPSENNNCNPCQTTEAANNANNALIADREKYSDDIFKKETEYIRFILGWERTVQVDSYLFDDLKKGTDCDFVRNNFLGTNEEWLYKTQQLLDIANSKCSYLFKKYKKDKGKLPAIIGITLSVERQRQLLGMQESQVGLLSEIASAVSNVFEEEIDQLKKHDYKQLGKLNYLFGMARSIALLGESVKEDALNILLEPCKFTLDIELDTKVNMDGGAYWLAHIKATKAKLALVYDKDDKEGCVKLVPYHESDESDKTVKFTVLNSETIGAGNGGYKYSGSAEISIPLKIYLPDLCTDASKAIVKIENISPSEKEKPESYLNNKIGKTTMPIMDEIFHYAFDPNATLASFKSQENNFVDDIMTESQWKKPLSEKYLTELAQLMQTPEFLNNSKVGRGSRSELTMAIYLHNNGLKSAEDKRKEAQGKPVENQNGQRPQLKFEVKLINNNATAINERVDGKAKTNKPKIVYAYATIQLSHKVN